MVSPFVMAERLCNLYQGSLSVEYAEDICVLMWRLCEKRDIMPEMKKRSPKEKRLIGGLKYVESD